MLDRLARFGRSAAAILATAPLVIAAMMLLARAAAEAPTPSLCVRDAGIVLPAGAACTP